MYLFYLIRLDFRKKNRNFESVERVLILKMFILLLGIKWMFAVKVQSKEINCSKKRKEQIRAACSLCEIQLTRL